MNQERTPDLAKEYLMILRRDLNTTIDIQGERREEKMAKYIDDLEWYMRIRKALEAGDRSGNEDLLKEYFSQKDRYQDFEERFGFTEGVEKPKFTTRELELFLQEVKSWSGLAGGLDGIINKG